MLRYQQAFDGCQHAGSSKLTWTILNYYKTILIFIYKHLCWLIGGFYFWSQQWQMRINVFLTFISLIYLQVNSSDNSSWYISKVLNVKMFLLCRSSFFLPVSLCQELGSYVLSWHAKCYKVKISIILQKAQMNSTARYWTIYNRPEAATHNIYSVFHIF